jgi:hypothetical protein
MLKLGKWVVINESELSTHDIKEIRFDDNRELVAKVEVLENTIQSISAESQSLRKQLDFERAKMADLSAKIRTQTEADLVLVSLQIILKTLQGKPKEKLTGLYDQQAAYQRQLAGMGQTASQLAQPCYGGVTGGIFSGLGLGGIL